MPLSDKLSLSCQQWLPASSSAWQEGCRPLLFESAGDLVPPASSWEEELAPFLLFLLPLHLMEFSFSCHGNHGDEKNGDDVF